MNAQLLSQTRFGNFIGLLLLAAFALACGGSPSASEDKKDVTQEPSSSQLSFGEYLAVCAGLASSGAIDEEITFEEFMKEFPPALGAFTERLEAVEPPEEVTDWHNAVLVYQRALKMELDDGPGEGESLMPELLNDIIPIQKRQFVAFGISTRARGRRVPTLGSYPGHPLHAAGAVQIG